MLESQRRTHHGDKEALNMQVVSSVRLLNIYQTIYIICAAQHPLKHTFHFQQDHKNKVTTLRHLLSADTRDERVNWCSVISRSLASLRAWDPTSSRPLR